MRIPLYWVFTYVFTRIVQPVGFWLEFHIPALRDKLVPGLWCTIGAVMRQSPFTVVDFQYLNRAYLVRSSTLQRDRVFIDLGNGPVEIREGLVGLPEKFHKLAEEDTRLYRIDLQGLEAN